MIPHRVNWFLVWLGLFLINGAILVFGRSVFGSEPWPLPASVCRQL